MSLLGYYYHSESQNSFEPFLQLSSADQGDGGAEVVVVMMKKFK